jgi:hypothetical protein
MANTSTVKKISALTNEDIKNAYIDYVLSNNEPPRSVYDFAKKLKITEAEFYNHYASFIAIEKSIWADLTSRAIEEVKLQEAWNTYTSREKMLSFFFAYVELLKTQRSFVIYSLRKSKSKISTPVVLADAKPLFLAFSENVIHSGLESGELASRKYFSEKYKDALWLQLAFIINFWIEDDSNGFEKTDEAIEKGVQVTFDLFQRSAIDNLFEYGKFLVRNGKIREKMGI